MEVIFKSREGKVQISVVSTPGIQQLGNSTGMDDPTHVLSAYCVL